MASKTTPCGKMATPAPISKSAVTMDHVNLKSPGLVFSGFKAVPYLRGLGDVIFRKTTCSPSYRSLPRHGSRSTVDLARALSRSLTH
ncbi:hypothetical protein TNCV_3100951 [Trichonephila clavipes]|nr:hypothetical protein TNCV_3100951 [Trichonephila clavipes]